MALLPQYSLQELQQARLSRDPRFDGLFFIGVKTTGIFCRTICPANLPKESNVEYLTTAIEAQNRGYRPCLRCRPDSAPKSNRWEGTQTTFKRALDLIDNGELQNHSLSELCTRLGISERYLRQLFNQFLGVSPKQYALYQQCLFAKSLLHQTNLPVTEIAFASGFLSLRRFNDAFKKNLGLTPSQIRKQRVISKSHIQIEISYRPPFDHQAMLKFLQARAIDGFDGVENNSYYRSFQFEEVSSAFRIEFASNNKIKLSLMPETIPVLFPLIQHVKAIFDINANSTSIDNQLAPLLNNYRSGMRLPLTFSPFEAGIRAIIGQQVSVKAAKSYLTTLINELGGSVEQSFIASSIKCFPSPKAIAESSLSFLRMPESRKHCLKAFSQCFVNSESPSDQDLLALKGIGPWTLDYYKMRGKGDSNIFLSSDLGIKKALLKNPINPEFASPWKSYLTLQLWNSLE